MTVTFEASSLPGVGRIEFPVFEDARGTFTKVLSPTALGAAGTTFNVREVYWTCSHEGVIRGLHFQRPPSAVAKVVFVTAGRIRDVVVDLRADSPTYGRHAVFDLTARNGAVVVPLGCAHGFEVLSGPAVACYLQDGPFDADADAGVLWDTAGVGWSTANPIISKRDRNLPPFETFESPFRVSAP